MSEKVDFGQSRLVVTLRTPVLTFTLIRWDWINDKRKDSEPIDITYLVHKSQWQKSIKTPASNGTLTMIPQYRGVHGLDFISTMDVVEIREFGRLVYQGYVRSISAQGQITQSGTPQRYLQLHLQGMGGLILDGQLGLNMFLKAGTYIDMDSKIKNFAGKIADLVKADKAYADIVGALIEEWFSFLEDNGASSYRTYIDEWMNLSSGLSGKTIPGVPKDLHFFYSSDQQMSLWSVLQKAAETPFNELWFDNGSRNVWFERNKTVSPSRPGEVKLNEEKTYLILRQTPFNGTIINGSEKDLWDALPIKKIPLGYYTRWDLNKTMEESFSFYMVSPAIFNPGELALIVKGAPEFDENALNKYLYRPITHNLFYGRTTSKDEPKLDDKAQANLDKDIKDKTKTLKNWFEKNDQYLSGSISMNVPNDEKYEPRIGERIQLEGMGESTFYVEAVTHSWQYQSPLTSNITVTRGYGNKKPIELKDKIFKRGKFSMDSQWKG